MGRTIGATLAAGLAAEFDVGSAPPAGQRRMDENAQMKMNRNSLSVAIRFDSPVARLSRDSDDYRHSQHLRK